MSCADIVVLILNILTLSVAIITLISTKRQFKENMKKQEKAINISLFDLRTEILENAQSRKMSFSKTRAAFLFDDRICELIEQYDNLCSERFHYEKLERDYHLINRLEESFGGEVAREFLDMLYKYERMDPNDPAFEITKNMIDQKRIVSFEPSGENTYKAKNEPSFIEVQRHLSELSDGITESRNRLIEEMKDFIQKSID